MSKKNLMMELLHQKLEYLQSKFDEYSNAEHNEGADIDELWVSQVMVDEAPTIKRYRARAKGRGTRILKRNCHITLSVSDEPRNAATN